MHVVVTGASTGIGRAIALRYARRGAAVGLIARREALLRELAGEIGAVGGSAAVAVADVGVRSGVERAIEHLRASFGPVDLLVNNAGMPGGAPFADLDVARIERVTAVNFLGAVWATKAVLPDMLERGSGSIVFIASIAGTMGAPRAGAYSGTKFALVGLAESLRLELAGSGVRVITVNPGPVRTESWPHRDVPRALVLGPEAIARAVVRAVDRGRPTVTRPRYYAPLAALRGIAPPLYRAILGRYEARRPDGTSPDPD